MLLFEEEEDVGQNLECNKDGVEDETGGKEGEEMVVVFILDKRVLLIKDKGRFQSS